MKFAEKITQLIQGIQDNGNVYIPDKGFRISSMAWPCDRQIQLRHRPELYLPTDVIEQSKQRRQENNRGINPMVIGSLLHEWIQENLETEDIEGRVEYTHDGVVLTGHYDLIFTFGEERVIADIKTTTQFAAKYLPNPHHIDQLTLYMGVLGISHGALIYVFRDKGNLVVHDVEFDRSRFEQLLQRAKSIQEAEDQGILLPTIIPGRGGFPCSYCEWEEICRR